MFVNNFFKLFFVAFLNLSNSNSDILSYIFLLVNNFFEVFSKVIFKQNGERGIRTLAPLLTTYSLSRGAPSAAWVLLHKRLNRRDTFDLSNVSNGEGGIRTHAPLRTNGFQDRLVMTTSIPLHNVFCCCRFVCLTRRLVYNTKPEYICQHFF